MLIFTTTKNGKTSVTKAPKLNSTKATKKASKNSKLTTQLKASIKVAKTESAMAKSTKAPGTKHPKGGVFVWKNHNLVSREEVIAQLMKPDQRKHLQRVRRIDSKKGLYRAILLNGKNESSLTFQRIGDRVVPFVIGKKVAAKATATA